MYPCIERAGLFPDKIAINDKGNLFTYTQLSQFAATIGAELLLKEKDLFESRVAFMIPPGKDYVATLWGIWQAGGVAVPLCLTYPFPSLQYVIEDTGSEIIVVAREYASLFDEYCRKQNIRLLIIESIQHETTAKFPKIDANRRALILYTSGTTSKPKGVVTSHANITAQVTTLIDAWGWKDHDSTLCVLPLHHVHGIINVVCCSLYAGATCIFVEGFSAPVVFDWLISGKLTVFMAVPTIYFKLISYWETLPTDQQSLAYTAMSKLRLMVCGSAALPVSVMEKWASISGQLLLERYGMTEIGMAISNPYLGDRRAGYVGIPLPLVDVKLVDDDGVTVSPGAPGEIWVKGPNVFQEYWQRPEATRESFSQDGWFITGDVAIVEDGYYRIMGRKSMDIIKSGGYKISALEIEEVLRTHPCIEDCAVVGLPDDEWGELIVAALVVNQPELDTQTLHPWLREKMAAYKTPRKYCILPDLPRNAMGKVVKTTLKEMLA
ncbi:MAG: acyl-CoA synthetase [Chitinophagia bacterium]|jgi:malonyl-CoA/methylmalonyl-CoA synthetase